MNDLEFKECRECASKSGTPLLCPSCIQNRTTIERWQKAHIGKIGETQEECLDLLEKMECELCSAYVYGKGPYISNCEGGGVCNAGKVRRYIEKLKNKVN
jgi:hypothetical protein